MARNKNVKSSHQNGKPEAFCRQMRHWINEKLFSCVPHIGDISGRSGRTFPKVGKTLRERNNGFCYVCWRDKCWSAHLLASTWEPGILLWIYSSDSESNPDPSYIINATMRWCITLLPPLAEIDENVELDSGRALRKHVDTIQDLINKHEKVTNSTTCSALICASHTQGTYGQWTITLKKV